MAFIKAHLDPRFGRICTRRFSGIHRRCVGRPPNRRQGNYGWGGVRLACLAIELLHQLDLARPPLLREERFERAVEAQDREPALARDRSESSCRACTPVGLVRAEVDRRRAVGVRLRRRATDSSGCRRAGSAAACRASSASGCRRASTTRSSLPECPWAASPCRSWRRRSSSCRHPAMAKRYCEPMPGTRMAMAGVMPVTP